MHVLLPCILEMIWLPCCGEPVSSRVHKSYFEPNLSMANHLSSPSEGTICIFVHGREEYLANCDNIRMKNE